MVHRMLRTSLCFLLDTFLLDAQFFHQPFDYEMIILIRTIMEHHGNLFWCFVPQITDAIDHTHIFLCVMTVIPNLTVAFISIQLFIKFLMIYV